MDQAKLCKKLSFYSSVKEQKKYYTRSVLKRKIFFGFAKNLS
jgi:hypothetical protein